jgi:hypothetical protein
MWHTACLLVELLLLCITSGVLHKDGVLTPEPGYGLDSACMCEAVCECACGCDPGASGAHKPNLRQFSFPPDAPLSASAPSPVPAAALGEPRRSKRSVHWSSGSLDDAPEGKCACHARLGRCGSAAIVRNPLRGNSGRVPFMIVLNRELPPPHLNPSARAHTHAHTLPLCANSKWCGSRRGKRSRGVPAAPAFRTGHDPAPYPVCGGRWGAAAASHTHPWGRAPRGRRGCRCACCVPPTDGARTPASFRCARCTGLHFSGLVVTLSSGACSAIVPPLSKE